MESRSASKLRVSSTTESKCTTETAAGLRVTLFAARTWNFCKAPCRNHPTFVTWLILFARLRSQRQLSPA